jgi:hypothetical protein
VLAGATAWGFLRLAGGSEGDVVSGTFTRFHGEIAGLGTAAGHRIVVGRWTRSPFGPFADVMHEAPDGIRSLLAPTDEIAGFVSATYRFDRVAVVPVAADRSADHLRVVAGDLHAELALGARTPLGWALRAVPSPVARSRWWCALVDPVAQRLLPGVRTRGTAGNGRREWYGATDQRGIVAVRAALDGRDLGALTEVWPPVRFGFGSAPRRPSVVAVTTTVRETVPPSAGFETGREPLQQVAARHGRQRTEDDPGGPRGQQQHRGQRGGDPHRQAERAGDELSHRPSGPLGCGLLGDRAVGFLHGVGEG